MTGGGAPAERAAIRRLMLFFATVYVVEGIGQAGGLIAQPLAYYLKQSLGWTPLQVTGYLAVLNLPWVIKPLYGIISDFVPLFGYRRKAWLILANLVATAGYCTMVRLAAPGALILALSATAYAMAISSTLAGAVLVENGQRYGASDAFVNQQWLWFNVAAMGSALLGGQLVARLSPDGALHAAAAVIAVAPLAAVAAATLLISEPKNRIDLTEMRRTLAGFLRTFRLRELWLIGLFLFLYYLNPGFGTPLYYYMTDTLKFSQAYIGGLGAISSAGWITGAIGYRLLRRQISARRLLNLSILAGILSTASFLLLRDEASAAVVNFCAGAAGMLAFTATLSLAADFCPQRAEGFAFAALMSVLNLASTLSDNIGAFLYEHVFDNQLRPLILLSAGFTAMIFLFVPLLRLGDKQVGTPAAAPR